MKKRSYRLGRRAETQEETRRRIVEATVALHENPGPRLTTISAIAERAGVQRLTVYRHFPDDAALFAACSSHWQAQHPLPDPAGWLGIAQWRARCRAALGAIYPYYRANAPMLASISADADLPVMKAPMQGFTDYLDAVADALRAAAPPPLAADPAFAATVHHVTRFATWHGLSVAFDDDGALVDLALRWLDGVAPGKRRPPARNPR